VASLRSRNVMTAPHWWPVLLVSVVIAEADAACAPSRSVLQQPIPLNSPVFSLATLSASGEQNMNVLTFATPVGVRPVRVWAISLWRGTATHAAFSEQRTGVLQQLAAHHAPLILPLGGHSMKNEGGGWKAKQCDELGFAWEDGPDSESVLPGCLAYYKLKQQGELINAGEHDVAICTVDGAWTTPGVTPEALSTQSLRDAGIITAAGRAVRPGDI